MPHPRSNARQTRGPRLIRALVLSIAAAATAAIVTSPASTSEQGGHHDGKRGGGKDNGDNHRDRDHDGKDHGGNDRDDKDRDDRHKPKVVKKVIVKRVVERRVVNRYIETNREHDRRDNIYDNRRTRRLSPVNGACQCAGAPAYTAEVSAHGYAAAGGHVASGAYAIGPAPVAYAPPAPVAYAPVPAPQPKPVVTHSYAPQENVVIRRYSATGHGLQGGAFHHGAGYGYGAGYTGGMAAIGQHHYSAPAIAGTGRHPTITRTAPWEPWVDGGSVVGPRAPGVYHENGATVVVRPPIYVPAGQGNHHRYGW